MGITPRTLRRRRPTRTVERRSSSSGARPRPVTAPTHVQRIPSWPGRPARIESANGDALGFAAPILYRLAGTPAIHDVTLGDAGAFPATPGYDLATGIGTLDVAPAEQLVTALGLAGAGPTSALPETPLAAGLPLAAVVMIGAGWLLGRDAAKPDDRGDRPHPTMASVGQAHAASDVLDALRPGSG